MQMLETENQNYPDSKVPGANMGPAWVLRPQMDPMVSPWTLLPGYTFYGQLL